MGQDALTGGGGFDSFLQLLLPAGAYKVTITQYDNFAIRPSLADGFPGSGQPNFTSELVWPEDSGQFRDNSGNEGCTRNGSWAFDVTIVERPLVAMPGPGIRGLLGIMVVGLLATASAAQPARRPGQSPLAPPGNIYFFRPAGTAVVAPLRVWLLKADGIPAFGFSGAFFLGFLASLFDLIWPLAMVASIQVGRAQSRSTVFKAKHERDCALRSNSSGRRARPSLRRRLLGRRSLRNRVTARG